MTSASFYRQTDKAPSNGGIYFEIPEDQLGKELQRRKNQEVSKAIQLDKLVTQNQEIKALKQKIQQGYLNKERAKQLAEKQVRRVDQLVNEAEFQAEMLKKKQKQQRQLQEVQAEKARRRYQAKDVIKRQMDEKADKQKQAYEQYLKQKEQVQKVMQTLINSQLRQMQEKDQKKKKAFQDMQIAFKLKEQQRIAEEELVRQQQAKYIAYVKQLDSRQEAVKKDRQEKEEIKNKIFQKLKIQEQRRRKDAQQLDSLRIQLYQEEYQALMRRKQQQQIEKRQRQRFEMQRAERDAKERKRLQKQQEERMQVEFRQSMMDKFAKQDKLQQLAQQKRRMKQLQHKKEVQRLWLQRLNAYRLQKEKQQQQFQKVVQNARWEQEHIQREKQRILKEHLPHLQGFMPKQLAKLSGTFNQQERTSYGNKFNI